VERHPLDRLRPELTLTDATLLVVSSVIGVGIFLTPGAVAQALPSPGIFLAAWAAGGLLSLAGALANAELGAMYPHAGGDYVYLRGCFRGACRACTASTARRTWRSRRRPSPRCC
jgi:APA family basic amino acid/polyamine antiporter